jgi:hypothetical protein
VYVRDFLRQNHIHIEDRETPEQRSPSCVIMPRRVQMGSSCLRVQTRDTAKWPSYPLPLPRLQWRRHTVTACRRLCPSHQCRGRAGCNR